MDWISFAAGALITMGIAFLLTGAYQAGKQSVTSAAKKKEGEGDTNASV